MPLEKVHELAFFLVWFAGVTPDSKKGSEKVLGKGSYKGACYELYSKKKSSEKGFLEGSFQKVPTTSSWREGPCRPAPYSVPLGISR